MTRIPYHKEAAILAMYVHEGKSLHYIAEKMKLHYHTVRRYVNSYKDENGIIDTEKVEEFIEKYQ